MAALACDPALVDYLLRLGDNVLVLGQQLSRWTGHAPILEEDLALTNVALDYIGQARLWLSYAGESEGRGRDEDRLTFFRDAHEFRNVLLVERPNGDYGDTLARGFLFDAWHYYLLEALCASRDERLAGIARKSIKEVAYHVRRGGEWIVRLGDGTTRSRTSIARSLDELWPYTGELFTSDAIDVALARSGIGAPLESLRDPWLAHVGEVLARATLSVPAGGPMLAGGKSGRHGEHFGLLLAEMQAVRRIVPGERW